MKKLILMMALAGATAIAHGQNSKRGFEPMFSKVANKSVSWNELFNFFKPLNTMESAMLLSKAVTSDPCQVIRNQSCERIDYYLFFKQNDGVDTFKINGSVLQLEYRFTTDSRRGTDTVTNIDTIRTASFAWKIKDSVQQFSKRDLEKLFRSSFARASKIINAYYGRPVESKDFRDAFGDKVLLDARWPHANSSGTLGNLRLKYDKKKRTFLLTFQTDIIKKAS